MPDVPDAGRSQRRLAEPVLQAALAAWRESGEQHVIAVAGWSMLPSLRDGDRLLVAHGAARLRRGDVVVFRRAGALIAHRLLQVIDATGNSPAFLVVRGDNTPAPDPPVRPEDVVGRVVAVERAGRRRSLDAPAWRVLGWLMALLTLYGSPYGRAAAARLLRLLRV